LLKDDGVIFVSIDDDEVHNLRKVMDEIYGEENFVAQIVWHSKYTTSNDAKYVSRQHEYLLMYAKNIIYFDIGLLDRTEEMDSSYKNPDNDPKGNWKSTPLHAKSGSENNIYTITFSNGKTWTAPQGRYPRYSKESLLKIYEEGGLYFNKNGGIDRKTYLSEVKQGKTVGSLWSYSNVGSSHQSNEELATIMTKGMFDNPKPLKLIQTCLKIANLKDDIILDFFAGSGTTAHAVMELNQEDGGNRKYILVQLPEATEQNSEAYKAGYKKISDITKERIKRVIKKLDYKDGFKSYKLDSSNFQVFKELKKRPNDSFEDIVKMLKMSVFNKNIFAQNAKEIDIVYEVGLKNGFSLSAKNESVKTKKYNFIKLCEENREFYFCFVDKIELDIADFIPNGSKLICFDKALDDSTKMNLKDKIDLETL